MDQAVHKHLLPLELPPSNSPHRVADGGGWVLVGPPTSPYIRRKADKRESPRLPSPPLASPFRTRFQRCTANCVAHCFVLRTSREKNARFWKGPQDSTLIVRFEDLKRHQNVDGRTWSSCNWTGFVPDFRLSHILRTDWGT